MPGIQYYLLVYCVLQLCIDSSQCALYIRFSFRKGKTGRISLINLWIEMIQRFSPKIRFPFSLKSYCRPNHIIYAGIYKSYIHLMYLRLMRYE